MQRPRGPPPPTPSTSNTLTNGQSSENIASQASSVEVSYTSIPTPSPRKVRLQFISGQFQEIESGTKIKLS